MRASLFSVETSCASFLRPSRGATSMTSTGPFIEGASNYPFFPQRFNLAVLKAEKPFVNFSIVGAQRGSGQANLAGQSRKFWNNPLHRQISPSLGNEDIHQGFASLKMRVLDDIG